MHKVDTRGLKLIFGEVWRFAICLIGGIVLSKVWVDYPRVRFTGIKTLIWFRARLDLILNRISLLLLCCNLGENNV